MRSHRHVHRHHRRRTDLEAGVVPGAETLQFRDVQAFSASVAYLMSIGANPTDFRIYKTRTAGPPGRYSSRTRIRMRSTTASRSGRRRALHTATREWSVPGPAHHRRNDWQDISNNMPPALPVNAPSRRVVLASQHKVGGTRGLRQAARRLPGSGTRDGGNTWNAYNTPLASSPSGAPSPSISVTRSMAS